MSLQLIILLGAYVLSRIVEYGLDILNLRHLKKFGYQVPPEFAGHIDDDLMRRTEKYTVAHTRFGIIGSLFDETITLVFIFSGLMLWYAEIISTLNLNLILSGLIFFLVLGAADTLLDIPFDLFDTFRLEKRFGFNRTTPKTWITDQLKSMLLTAILSGIMLSAAILIYLWLPQWWWLAVWFFFFIFTMFMMYISPYVLEPLFNKFTPIEDEELVHRISDVLARAGIKVKGVFKMDASRRTSHTNAYFTGIGREKRIVIYDTLLEKLDSDEIIAVLAHEAGHCRKKHIIKMLTLFESGSLVAAYLAFFILNSTLLNWLFGVETDNLFVKLILLGFAASALTWPLSPLQNLLSRRFEREADAFACQIVGSGEALATALIKLSKDNLSNLHPHPWYSAFHYSHPPAIERIRYLRKFQSDQRA